MFNKEWYFMHHLKPIKMAKLKTIIDFCTARIQELEEEITQREESFYEKSASYQDTEEGLQYEAKTEALEELKELIFEVQVKSEQIQNKEYY